MGVHQIREINLDEEDPDYDDKVGIVPHRERDINDEFLDMDDPESEGFNDGNDTSSDGEMVFWHSRKQ